MIRTQVQLTEKQVSLLKKMASEKHTSIAELVRQAVDNLTKSSTYIDVDERRNRAIAAAGRFRSGISDLSSNHDTYVAEAFKE